MVNWKSKKLGDFLLLANGLVLIILINLVASIYSFRIDLTEEKRYSIKEPTKELLKNLDDKVYVEVYLAGELNAPFRRFQKAIRETLEEFRINSGNKVQYTFIDPSTAISQKARTEFISDLASKGVQPTNVIDNDNGQRIERLIFPGAVISYAGAETGVTLLKGNKARTPEEEINQSIEGIEFELANVIYKLTNIDRKKIGIVKGHGELDSLDLAGFTTALVEVYDVFDVVLGESNLAQYDVLVVAKPTKPFSEQDKYALDQYIMKGGRVIFMIDKLEASMDSVSRPGYLAFPYQQELDDQLFKYGVRINMDLIQDRSSGKYPVVTGQTGGKPRMQLLDWPFFPLVNHYADHPITRNLDAVVSKFASSIDTVKALGVKKTPLLFTSQNARTITAPVSVNINDLRQNVDPSKFETSYIPLGYLLEGKFTSLYKNRFLPNGVDKTSFEAESVPTKIIVIADGDLVRNEINPRTQQPQPLGFDPFINITFANQDLVMNMFAFMTDENGLIRTRNKEVKIRPLDKEKIANEKLKWQTINLVVPVVLLIAYGIIRSLLRKKKYSQF
ncbi:gliding motility-associated ABC transporter substrate-binding protein GldG [Chryseosolibacter indicus]|uniref:Gliding motility-associated ABC transporter substrate-binding protein GldG n=1 Tax=Chryseosolibacter indicus TaxID=2782351 RepID=A0ABS5VW65_9BACT|nr:gliding motility-associated ABC transporter substrate-binding protein GldG [Chryseosolibacter indicus]MBT1705670.1 gliding motility-associated ABC transporter substrate-binding protein GldG [Chryseosolibacter indicus]